VACYRFVAANFENSNSLLQTDGGPSHSKATKLAISASTNSNRALLHVILASPFPPETRQPDLAPKHAGN
jgi:hypothetical protein